MHAVPLLRPQNMLQGPATDKDSFLLILRSLDLKVQHVSHVHAEMDYEYPESDVTNEGYRKDSNNHRGPSGSSNSLPLQSAFLHLLPRSAQSQPAYSQQQRHSGYH